GRVAGVRSPGRSTRGRARLREQEREENRNRSEQFHGCNLSRRRRWRRRRAEVEELPNAPFVGPSVPQVVERLRKRDVAAQRGELTIEEDVRQPFPQRVRKPIRSANGLGPAAAVERDVLQMDETREQGGCGPLAEARHAWNAVGVVAGQSEI